MNATALDSWLSRTLPSGARIPADHDVCGTCDGRGEASYAAGEGEVVERCHACRGAGHIETTYVVVLHCDLACEGATCACLGDGWRRVALLAWELLAQPETVGTPAQRAEAALICAAQDAEDEAPAEPVAAE